MFMEQNRTLISLPRFLKFVGITAGTVGLCVVLLASLAYALQHPDFSLFKTFLSTIGDTPGWPQVIFNSGTLIVVPLRYLVIILFALRLYHLGAGRTFMVSVLVIGFLSTLGTYLMTAVPFSLAPAVHKTGIGFYFLGIVILQSVVFIKQWSMKGINRWLPIISMVVVLTFISFFTLLMLYERGIIGPSAAVFFEWLCFTTSIIWVFAQSILLSAPLLHEGKE